VIHKGFRGFTLIEVLVAIGIFAVVVLGALAPGIYYFQRTIHRSISRNQLITILSSYLEDWGSRPYTLLDSLAGAGSLSNFSAPVVLDTVNDPLKGRKYEVRVILVHNATNGAVDIGVQVCPTADTTVKLRGYATVSP